MSGFEWFLLVVVVILVPLVVAVAITLWTLEQARQRNRRNREGANPGTGPVKRKATRDAGQDAALVVASTGVDSTRERTGDDAGAASTNAARANTTFREPETSGNEGSGIDDGSTRVTPQGDATPDAAGADRGPSTDGPGTDSAGTADGGTSSGDGGGGGDS